MKSQPADQPAVEVTNVNMMGVYVVHVPGCGGSDDDVKSLLAWFIGFEVQQSHWSLDADAAHRNISHSWLVMLLFPDILTGVCQCL